jgi:hypothetical protein
MAVNRGNSVKLNLGETFFGTTRALALLTVLLPVAAILHSIFLMPDRSLRISHLSDVNNQIRRRHSKIPFSLIDSENCRGAGCPFFFPLPKTLLVLKHQQRCSKFHASRKTTILKEWQQATSPGSNSSIVVRPQNHVHNI